MIDLLYDLDKIINKDDEEDENKENKRQEEIDPETGKDFRIQPILSNEEDNGKVIIFNGGGNLDDRPLKKRGIHNNPTPPINSNNASSISNEPMTMKISKKKKTEEKKEEKTEINSENNSESKNQTNNLINSENSMKIEQPENIIENNISKEIERSNHQEINFFSENNEEEIKTNNKLIITRESIEKDESSLNNDKKSDLPKKSNYNQDDLQDQNIFASITNFNANKNNDEKKSEAKKIDNNEYDNDEEKSLSHIDGYLPKENEEQNNQSENDFKLTNNNNNIIDSEEEDNNNNKIKIKKKKKGGKKKNENKFNPPARNPNINGNALGPGIASDRSLLRSNHNNVEKEDDKSHWDFDTFYKKIVYDIKIKTNNQKDFIEFKKEQKWPFLYLFLSKFLSNSTLFFIFPWSICYKSDKDGLFVKLVVLILFIAFYMSFNIITATKLSTLHLWTSKLEEDTPNSLDRFINYFIPFIVLYLPIGWMKRSLSMTMIYFHLHKEIETLKDKFDEVRQKHSDSNPNFGDEKNNKKKLKDLRMEAKELDTEIKKQRNQMETKTKLVLLYGFILLFINLILLTNFCGIYINSFSSLFYNMLSSMLFTFLFSLLLQLVSTILKYFECSRECVRFKLSECLSCQYLLYGSYYLVCKLSFCICCDCFREEFYENIEIKENKDKKNNNEGNNQNSSSGDNTQRNNDEIRTTNSIITNQKENSRGHTYRLNEIMDYRK